MTFNDARYIVYRYGHQSEGPIPWYFPTEGGGSEIHAIAAMVYEARRRVANWNRLRQRQGKKTLFIPGYGRNGGLVEQGTELRKR